MKTIFLIRHAEAEDLNGLSDSFRGLTKRGSAQANEMGALCRQLPSKWLVSPAIRTYATAYIMAAHQQNWPKIELVPELYMSSGNAYLNCLYCLPNEIESIAIVGHNPSISELYYFLTKQAISFKKGCVAEIQINASDWISLVKSTGNQLSLKVPTL